MIMYAHTQKKLLFFNVRLYLVFLACHTHTNCKTIKPSIKYNISVPHDSHKLLKHFSGQAAIFS